MPFPMGTEHTAYAAPVQRDVIWIFSLAGAIGSGGSLPTNTGGGQLSSYYMWGMTPISEAIIQGPGQDGQRQAANQLILVSGNGGTLQHHSTLLLSPEAKA